MFSPSSVLSSLFSRFSILPLSLVTRDLKPTNVLLDENDRPVLMDLGSMNKARIEVRGSREAMTIQVRLRCEWTLKSVTV